MKYPAWKRGGVKNRFIMWSALFLLVLFVIPVFSMMGIQPSLMSSSTLQSTLDDSMETFSVETVQRGNGDSEVDPSLPSSALAYSYEPLWNRTYGGVGDDYGRVIASCADGGYVLGGYGSSFGAGGWDAYVLRLDADGNRLWNRTFGGINDDWLEDLIVCHDGGFAFVGTYTYSSSNVRQNLWVVRLNSTGHEQWNRTFGHPYVGFLEQGKSLVECSDDGLAVVGIREQHVSGFWYGWIIRLDRWGTVLWDRLYGEDFYARYFNRILRLRDDEFIIAGHYEPSSFGINSTFLFHTNSTGHMIWNQTLKILAEERAYGLVRCLNEGFAYVGCKGTSFGCHQVLLFRTNSTGHQLWNETYGGPFCRGLDLLQTSDEEFFITGRCGDDGALIRTDNNGSTIWMGSYGGPGKDCLYSIIEAQEGGFLLAGYTDSYGAGGRDMWLVRLSLPSWETTPVDQELEINEPFLYDLSAIADGGIQNWWINDTQHFAINLAGVLSNASSLPAGNYGLQILVTDTINNILSANIMISVVDTTAPVWLRAIPNLIHEFGQPLDISFQGTAFDYSSIADWWVNDTEHFHIDAAGHLTNASWLPAAVYDIEIRAIDPYANFVSVICTIAVVDSIPPDITLTQSTFYLTVGFFFSYQLHGQDPSGIDHWEVSDPAHFIIDADGVINSIGMLAIGTYLLDVTCYDSHNNPTVIRLTIIVSPVAVLVPGIALGVIIPIAAWLFLEPRIRRSRSER